MIALLVKGRSKLGINLSIRDDIILFEGKIEVAFKSRIRWKAGSRGIVVLKIALT